MTPSNHIQVLAASGLFDSGRDLLLGALGFLAILAIVGGTVSAVRAHIREGAGSGITAQIGAIVMGVLVFLSVGIAAALTREANNHGIRNQVNVESPWGSVTVTDEGAAKIYSDQRDLPIFLGDSGEGFMLPLKEKWRMPDAFAAVFGFIITAGLVTMNLASGNALTMLVLGSAMTALAVWALSKLPHSRPSLPTRAAWWLADLHPATWCSHPAAPDRTP